MVYLRVWANELRVPIISVDYSLSPQAQAGQALAECVYAYMWVLANAGRLGADQAQIVVTGDSAGGTSQPQTSKRCVWSLSVESILSRPHRIGSGVGTGQFWISLYASHVCDQDIIFRRLK